MEFDEVVVMIDGAIATANRIIVVVVGAGLMINQLVSVRDRYV